LSILGRFGFLAAKNLPANFQGDIWRGLRFVLFCVNRDAPVFDFERKRFDLQRLQHLPDWTKKMGEIEISGHGEQTAGLDPTCLSYALRRASPMRVVRFLYIRTQKS
jgi:hypothetical protein